jgi:hypothetical protein
MKIPTLSADLEGVINKKDGHHIHIGDFVSVAGDRAFGVVLILLSLPSALPIPAAGISTPLGIIMFLIALQMIFGRETLWIPKKMTKYRLTKKSATKMVHGLGWVLRQAEHIVKPRYYWIHTRAGHVYIGILVALLSIVMQMPIPLTNTLPAMMIFLLAVSLTEDDGLVAVLAGLVASCVILLYIAGFVAIGFYGFQGLDQFLDYLKSTLFNG